MYSFKERKRPKTNNRPITFMIQQMTQQIINNLRYADDTILMEESEEELKSLLKKVKEDSENTDLKLNIQKTKIMASSSILGLQNHCRW